MSLEERITRLEEAVRSLALAMLEADKERAAAFADGISSSMAAEVARAGSPDEKAAFVAAVSRLLGHSLGNAAPPPQSACGTRLDDLSGLESPDAAQEIPGHESGPLARTRSFSHSPLLGGSRLQPDGESGEGVNLSPDKPEGGAQ